MACVLLVPTVTIRYFFPQFNVLNFVDGFNQFFILIATQFGIAASSNWMFVAITLPWILLIIAIGILNDFLERLIIAIDEQQRNYNLQQTMSKIQKQDLEIKQVLQKKQVVYVALSLIFSKFTISNLSDREVEIKKEEIRKDLLRDLASWRGKFVGDVEFENDSTIGLMFLSQEDAINFVMKIKETISVFDNATQTFGYSLGFKALLNVETSNAMRKYVFDFMEKAMRTIEFNEICTTNDFADRYKDFGQMKNVIFTSKGNYSINKSRVELNRLDIF